MVFYEKVIKLYKLELITDSAIQFCLLFNFAFCRS